MTLLYYFKHRWFPDGRNPVQGIYLRPAEAVEDAILNIFSVENVKKMEEKLGKDWWKSSDET